MSFHFCSHTWEVQDVADGTRITLSSRDLNAETVSVLAEDLLEVVLESGRPNLYLDFAKIRELDSTIVSQLGLLNARLGQHGCRLNLIGMNPVLQDALGAAGVFDEPTRGPAVATMS